MRLTGREGDCWLPPRLWPAGDCRGTTSVTIRASLAFCRRLMTSISCCCSSNSTTSLRSRSFSCDCLVLRRRSSACNCFSTIASVSRRSAILTNMALNSRSRRSFVSRTSSATSSVRVPAADASVLVTIAMSRSSDRTAASKVAISFSSSSSRDSTSPFSFASSTTCEVHTETRQAHTRGAVT